MKTISKIIAPIAVLAVLSACSPQQDAEPTLTAEPSANQIDLIVNGDYVVTMDDAATVHSGAAVAIDQGVIIAIGPAAEIAASYDASEVLDGQGRVVMPGLVNGHSHAAMTLLRGVADDLALMDWLNNYIFPAEVEFVDAEFVRIGTELACWEMIRGGTTTFVDMYYYPDTVADVVDKCGQLEKAAALSNAGRARTVASRPYSDLTQITHWTQSNCARQGRPLWRWVYRSVFICRNHPSRCSTAKIPMA
jgi:5-methylthioadenosine/S-adenosylhomocysteine deaminase